jgi:hypothetical protein
VLWHTGANMLIEWWEKLRGYGKWPETTATVVSSVPTPAGVLDGDKPAKNPSATQWNSVVRIVWKDSASQSHSEQFEVGEESPLYQLCEQDMLIIRVKPGEPDEIYVRGLIGSKVSIIWKSALTILLACLVVLAYFLPDIVRGIQAFKTVSK